MKARQSLVTETGSMPALRPALLAFVLVLGACASSQGVESLATPESRALEGRFTWLDDAPRSGVRVGRYTSKPWGFRTNSFVIAGPEGSYLVDAQFLPSAAAELLEIVEAEGAGPVRGAFVLHPNPDKFNGTAVLQAAGVEVWTSEAVGAEIPEVFEARTAAFGPRYAPDWPSQTPAPAPIEAGARFELGDAQLELHELGPGCGAAHLVLSLERGDERGRELFVGDLAAEGTHLWLELGHLDAWRTRLAELEAMAPARVHPGRGDSGTVALLRANDAYLAEVRERVLAASEGEAGRAEVFEALVAAHPELRYAVFLNLGLPAVQAALRPGN
ncbi:beta lactamase precursor [Plesiocystis pacifica SIR-1]|uniref:Beta lactamase n=2 Tax=Plesiocystis pacifica TaxID=191768 RepID=A6GAR3_9BACT|nr:beta lactamase precursor [Plesiocystis pacifica SIR-1]